jgi:hypothetical protein
LGYRVNRLLRSIAMPKVVLLENSFGEREATFAKMIKLFEVSNGIAVAVDPLKKLKTHGKKSINWTESGRLRTPF